MQSHINNIIIRYRRLKWIFIGLFMAMIGINLIIKHRNHDEAVKPSISVVTVQAYNIDIPIYISALGNVVPESSVTIQAQVSGKLTKVLFEEGQEVTKGEILAEIDKKPYQAVLDQYEGQLKRDMALLENAKMDLVRYQSLSESNSISKQVLDTQKSLVKQYEAAIQLDQGLLDGARINLGYCDIKSPIDGQIGLRLIDAGNIIQVAANTSIASVNTLHPINVLFAVTEIDLNKIQAAESQNFDVIVYNQDQTKILANCLLLAIDNKIDPNTGTVQLKAGCNNHAKTLFPNQFVNIKLHIGTLYNALAVPASALQYGPKGSFVYKVIDDNTVKMTPVVTGTTSDDYIAITSGLNNGDMIVAQGIDKLTDNANIVMQK
jgi:membrane fusion protein, multidrug efflux system